MKAFVQKKNNLDKQTRILDRLMRSGKNFYVTSEDQNTSHLCKRAQAQLKLVETLQEELETLKKEIVRRHFQ